MEWVETTARSVDEAKELLLDQLGVDDSDTEFEILEEPKPGLFGRTKGQARVRARVKPKSPAARQERRRPAKKDNDRKTADRKPDESARAPKNAAPAPVEAEAQPRADRAPAASNGRAPRPEGPRLASDVAEREAIAFLEGVLREFGAEGTVAVEIDEDGDLSCEIAGASLGRLIGPRGGVISAIEELTRTRLQHVASGGSTPRFRLDIGGYRASRRPNLELLVDDVIARVRETGQPHVLDVVMAGERKLVHDRVAEHAPDVRTHSEGEDPVRRVVLSPT